jgi:FkbM family methyltransferase
METMAIPAPWIMKVRPAFVGSCLKKALRIKRRMVDTAHARLYVDPLSIFGFTILREGVYEPLLTTAVKDILRPGDTFVDLGANEGYFSIIAAKQVGTSGRVISIEPQSRLQYVLTRNIVENDVSNVLTVPCAVSDSVGTATLFLNPDITNGGSGLARFTRYRLPTEIVYQTTLSRLFHTCGVEAVRLMKMDIEGFEYETLLGSRELFRAGQIDHIAVDFQPHQIDGRGKSIAHLRDFLTECGYALDPRYQTGIWSHRRVMAP